MSVYRKYFDETKYISFWIKDDKLLNIYNNKFPWQQNTKNRFSIYLLTVILIDSVFRAGQNYYPQEFLQEWKCVVQEKKIPMYTDTEISNDSNV